MAARLLGRPSLLTRRQMVPMFKSQRPDRGVVQKYSCYSFWPLEVVVLPTLLLLLLALLHGTHVWVGVPAQKHTTSLLSSTASWCPCLRARGSALVCSITLAILMRSHWFGFFSRSIWSASTGYRKRFISLSTGHSVQVTFSVPKIKIKKSSDPIWKEKDISSLPVLDPSLCRGTCHWCSKPAGAVTVKKMNYNATMQ